jgi:hypothetical protein
MGSDDEATSAGVKRGHIARHSLLVVTVSRIPLTGSVGILRQLDLLLTFRIVQVCRVLKFSHSHTTSVLKFETACFFRNV